MRLYWQNGEDTTQLSGDIQLSFDGCDVSTVETTVSVQPAYDELVDSVLSNSEYGLGLPVTRINGVQPTDSGEFSIEGSECDSWDYDEENNRLVIVDLCPSCTTCETVYRLRYETENLRLWLNTLKDVNLALNGEPPNTDAGVTTYTMLSDASWLSAVRITGATTLSPAISTEPNFAVCMPGSPVDTSFLNLRGLELLKQYITLVHMWNYVVSQNNSSTEIQIAPEDTAGFVVQTKRALPSCGGMQTVRCTITVDVKTDDDTYTGTQQVIRDGSTTLSNIPISPYYLSVYVPEPSLDFQPFDNSVAHQCVPGSTVTAIEAITTAYLQVTSKTVSNVRSTYKEIDTGEITATVAGTYVLRAKFLPYIDMTLKNANGTTVDIRGCTTAIDGSTAAVQEDGSIEYSFISAPEYHINDNPTEDDYLRSKTAPTRSVNFKLVWVITVKWEVASSGDAAPQTFEQTYNYTCNGVREYYGANMESVTLSPLLPTPGETTSVGAV